METRAEQLLNEQELDLLRKMLMAVVDFPNLHVNRFRIKAVVGGKYEYFVGKQPSGGEAFPRTIFSSNIRDRLVALKFADAERARDAPEGTLKFTDLGMDWYREQKQRASRASDDDIRAELGRRAFDRRGSEFDASTVLDFNEIGRALNVTTTQIAAQASILLDLGYLRSGFAGTPDAGGGVDPMGPGDLLLNGRRGLEWAMSDFEPLRTYPRHSVNVSVGIHIEIQQFLSEIEDIDADPDEIEEATTLVRAFQDNPSAETLAPLMAFGANTLTFMIPILNLLVSNGDRIKQALGMGPLM